MKVVVLIAFLAIASAEVCRPTNNLQALDQTYKSHEDHVLFGRLTACPRLGEELSENIRYRLVNPIDGLVVQEMSGDMEYTPPVHFSGTVHFDYFVQDEQEQTAPARVTITIREVADAPSLDVNDVIVGLEGEDILLDIKASLEDTDGSERLSVALCSCAQDITCNRYSGKCHCHLSMPDGWHIYDSNNQPLPRAVLANLGTEDLEGLYLRPEPFSSGEQCLYVYAISQDRNTFDSQEANRQSHTKQEMRIHVKPLVKDPHVTHDGRHTPNNATQFFTTEGQPIKFTSLSLKDNDGIEGTYRVRVSVNEGGTLWVRQDIRDDVVFFPKETEIRADRTSTVKKDGEKKKSTVPSLDRYSDFHEDYQEYNDTTSSNGKKTLDFMGSLEGVNEILSTLLFVPWCSQWPTPPNWNLPESSWMEPHPWDQLSGMNNEERPVVWPQWYPRFWYPFPIKNWSWWPRVLPPWWLEQRCSDWESHIHLEAQEITPQTCDVDTNHPRAIWDADVQVESRTGVPKSLITDNLFTYFSADVESFLVKNIHIRSTQEEGKLRFRLSTNNSIGAVENMETRLPTFSCYTVTECNNLLKQIRVEVFDNSVCHLPIEISMYKEDSERLADYMMIWAVKSTDDCVNVRSNYPQFEIRSQRESIFVGQDGTVPLSIQANIQSPNMKGILHTTIQARDGLVTLSVPTGMRVYFDHMGRHHDGQMVTNFCMSGPAFEVVEALKTAKFTPLKNFKGTTEVVVEYGMTRTSLEHTYGIPKGTPVPKQSFRTKINVVNGQRPYFPVLSLPEKICAFESDITSLDMIRLERRYQEDEIVSVSLYVDQGTLSVDTEISALYACPSPSLSILSSCAIPDGCFTDDTCPGNQRCCGVAPGCGKQCTDPVEVGMVTSYNTHNVILHGKISTLNRVFEDMNIWYVAKPCQTDYMGRLITDRRIEKQTDNIRISVVPTRNPEGDSVIKYLNLDITCNTALEFPITEEVTDEGCTEEWGPWGHCDIENDEACGMGMQQRVKQCGNTIVESRPCLKCDCQVQNRTIYNPDYMMRTCESTRTVSMCPNTCEVKSSHHEVVEFSCTSENLHEITIVSSDIRVHDNCHCRVCSAYDVDKFGRIIDKTRAVGRQDVNDI